MVVARPLDRVEKGDEMGLKRHLEWDETYNFVKIYSINVINFFLISFKPSILEFYLVGTKPRAVVPMNLVITNVRSNIVQATQSFA